METTMETTLAIPMDDGLSVLLDKVTEYSGYNRNDIAREALRRQLQVMHFRNLREKVVPFAKAHGYLTDDDVFAHVS